MDVSEPDNQEVGLRSLRTVPALPLRAGRHLTSWVLWHAARVHLHHDDLARESRAEIPAGPVKRPH